MTRKELEKLYLIPLDIRKRQERIDKLEMMIAESEVTDVVQSSTDMGTASTIGHATIHGFNGMGEERATLKKLKAELVEKNEQLKKEYPVAVAMIENEKNPVLRAGLHLRLIDGYEYEDVAAVTAHGTSGSWQKAVGRWLDEWTDK